MFESFGMVQIVSEIVTVLCKLYNSCSVTVKFALKMFNGSFTGEKLYICKYEI